MLNRWKKIYKSYTSCFGSSNNKMHAYKRELKEAKFLKNGKVFVSSKPGLGEEREEKSLERKGGGERKRKEGRTRRGRGAGEEKKKRKGKEKKASLNPILQR